MNQLIEFLTLQGKQSMLQNIPTNLEDYYDHEYGEIIDLNLKEGFLTPDQVEGKKESTLE